MAERIGTDGAGAGVTGAGGTGPGVTGTGVTGRDLVLGVNVARTAARAQVLAAARSAEEAGFDVVTVADHLGAPAPFAVLAAVAAVTERVRLRSYVLDVYFWNPALLAREVATLDALSDGRCELGLGAGHMRHEHDDAGLPFPPHPERVATLEAVLREVRRRLADPGHSPEPVQRPVPVVVGGWGEATLAVAARHADVVALTGAEQVRGRPAGTLRLVGSARTTERLAALQRLTVHRPERPVLDALLQRVVVDRPAEQAAEELAAESGGQVGVGELLDSPFVLLAPDPAAAAQELVHRSQRYGITSWMTHSSSTDALAQVLRELR